LRRSFGLMVVLIGALAGAALLFSACAGAGGNGMAGMDMGGGSTGSINVNLMDWSVKPSKTSTKAGLVTFHVMYDMGKMSMSAMTEGGNVHDMQVARKNADGTFEIVGEVKSLRMGDSRNLTLNLTPGDYELQCNHTEELNGQVIAHYTKGMHTPFKVS
jgi:uncharacterized cupredoxin-like copper-binding protein